MAVTLKPECTGKDPITSLPIQDVLSVPKNYRGNPILEHGHNDVEQTTRREITAHPGLDLDQFQQQFSEYLGFEESMPFSAVIKQIAGGLFPPLPESNEKINFILAFVAAEKPASLLEAQMLVQLFATHQFFTQMLKKATDEKSPENIQTYVDIAMKVSEVYKNSLEFLAKYRRASGGDQNVIE
jgi:hypothetical protein